jgi:hypothetical protein
VAALVSSKRDCMHEAEDYLSSPLDFLSVRCEVCSLARPMAACPQSRPPSTPQNPVNPSGMGPGSTVDKSIPRSLQRAGVAGQLKLYLKSGRSVSP